MDRQKGPVLFTLEESAATGRKFLDQPDRFLMILAPGFAQNLHVGDIRGRGLFWGIELVADRQSKAPFDPKLGLAGKLKKAAFAEGLICYPMPGARDGQLGDHVLLAPPFISSEDELDDAQNRLQIALEKALSSAGE